MALLGSVTYTIGAETQLIKRHISKADVERIIETSTNPDIKGKTEEIRGLTSDGRLIVVRIERNTRPIKVVGVIAP